MAETLADSGLLSHDEGIDYVEIDFDDVGGSVLPDGDGSAGVPMKDKSSADDFDIQIDQYEVQEDAGDHTGTDGVPSGDVAQAEFAVPQSNTAESEIGYEDEEPLDVEAEVNDESAGSTGIIDEIDYDDGDMANDNDDNVGTEAQAAAETPLKEEVVNTEVSFHQVVDDTFEGTESTEAHVGVDADQGSTHESFKAADQASAKEENPLPQTEDDAEEPPTGSLAAKVADVMVLYNGVKYELCASVHNDDPETYFFADNDNLDIPLWEFFGRLRDVIKDEIEPSDDLVIEAPQLKLEIGENTSYEFLDKYTFRDIIELYRRFKHNDGLEDSEHPQFVVHLLAKPNCQDRFAMLTAAANAGRGWSEIFDNSDGSGVSCNHHFDSGEEFDGEDQVETTFGEEHRGANGDNETQHEGVEIVAETYFYDDTNDAGGQDGGHTFGDQDEEDPGHYAADMEDLNEGYWPTAEVEEVDAPHQATDDPDEQMGHFDGSTRRAYNAEENGNASMSHDITSNKDLPNPTDSVAEVAGVSTSGGNLENLSEEAVSALEASNTFQSGKYPLSFRPPSGSVSPTQQEWLDDFLDHSPQRTNPGMCETFGALPQVPTSASARGVYVADEEFIDYSDDDDSFERPTAQHKRHSTPISRSPRRCDNLLLDGPALSGVRARSQDDADDGVDSELDHDLLDHQRSQFCEASAAKQGKMVLCVATDDDVVFDVGERGTNAASMAWLKQALPGCPPSTLLAAQRSPSPLQQPSRGTHESVRKYRAASISKHPEASHQAKSSISPGQAGLMMQSQTAFSSTRIVLASSNLAHASRSSLSLHSGANLSDLQDQDEPAIQHEAASEAAFDTLPRNDVEHVFDNAAANGNSIDMESFATYPETQNNEPPVADPPAQVLDAHDTSSTSTINGDEITYEDDDVAHAEAGDGPHEARDIDTEDVDEIDWENDGAEDVAGAADPTNQPSPSSLSIKRGREEDDLIGLDDETDAKRRKI